MSEPLNILCIGAHPDDCDIRVGGLAIKYARLGHRVKFVSLTNGNTGHFSMGGGAAGPAALCRDSALGRHRRGGVRGDGHRQLPAHAYPGEPLARAAASSATSGPTW